METPDELRRIDGFDEEDLWRLIRPLREQARSHMWMRSPVGASLLAKTSAKTKQNQETAG
jgi:hypothetical protein